MDERRFDDLSRVLGDAATRRAGLKAVLAAVLGGAAAIAALEERVAADKDRSRGPEADKRKRRKRCDPACAAGQTCVKGVCACGNGGTACGASCCLIGQQCEGGQCVEPPDPDACIAYGEPCKGVGRRCCAGLVCGSGQGGQDDVRCYVQKTGACTDTAECTFGTRCEDGICTGIPQPTPEPTPAPGPQCVEQGGACPDAAGCCGGSLCVDGACNDCDITGAHIVNYGKNDGDGSSGSGDGEFNKPRKVAFLADGRMLVADQNNNRIQIWTGSGGSWTYQASIPAAKWSLNCATPIGTTFFEKPFALAVDPLDPGVFYYIGQYGCIVMGCTGSGTSWTCSPAITETNFSQVAEYTDIAFDSMGRMFLAQESDNSSITGNGGSGMMIDRPAGGWAAQQGSWPLSPTATFFADQPGSGQSDDPQGIAVGPDGAVYVADTAKNRITVWTETSPGTFVFDSEFGTLGAGAGNLSSPRGVDVAGDRVVVTDSGNARISLWKRTAGVWTNTATFPDPATAGSGAAQLNSPSHSTLHSDGYFYVADTNNNRVSIWKAACQS